MPEMYLRQVGFTYSACGPFTKSNERISKFKETGDSRYIYQNELDKACFQHGMAYGDFKDLIRRSASDKILRDKAFCIEKIPKCDGYYSRSDPMLYKLFDKNTSATHARLEILATRNKFAGSSIISNKYLAEESHKPNRKLKKEKYTHLL